MITDKEWGAWTLANNEPTPELLKVCTFLCTTVFTKVWGYQVKKFEIPQCMHLSILKTIRIGAHCLSCVNMPFKYEASLTFLSSQEASGAAARVTVLLPASAVAPSLCQDGADATPCSFRAPKTPIAFQPTSGTPSGIGNSSLSGSLGSVDPRSWISSWWVKGFDFVRPAATVPPWVW